MYICKNGIVPPRLNKSMWFELEEEEEEEEWYGDNKQKWSNLYLVDCRELVDFFAVTD